MSAADVKKFPPKLTLKVKMITMAKKSGPPPITSILLAVVTNATGSDRGIQALLAGSIDIVASSRPLTVQKQDQGLVMMPVATDAIAVVIGEANPLQKGLTRDQVVRIFQGQITDWSTVGGPVGTIRVINRPPVSGTYRVFQELVLAKGNFGRSPNVITLQRDATTPLLQALKTDGIGYATYSQIANQQTVRTVAIDGLTPEAQNYPYKRTLYYVYKEPPSAPVQAFLGYTTSLPGKQALTSDN